MKIEVYPDQEAVAGKAAAIIAAHGRDAVTSRGRFIVAVSGGHTPWLMLRALSAEQLPWEHVHRISGHQRRGMAVRPKPEMDEVEHRRRAGQIPQRRGHIARPRGGGPAHSTGMA